MWTNQFLMCHQCINDAVDWCSVADGSMNRLLMSRRLTNKRIKCFREGQKTYTTTRTVGLPMPKAFKEVRHIYRQTFFRRLPSTIHVKLESNKLSTASLLLAVSSLHPSANIHHWRQMTLVGYRANQWCWHTSGKCQPNSIPLLSTKLNEKTYLVHQFQLRTISSRVSHAHS